MSARVTLNGPSLFRATARAVSVDMDNGEPFYYRDMRPGQRFTLPAGTWQVTGASFVRPIKGAPRFDASRLPEQFRVEVGINPHMASVWPDSGRILLDRSVMDLPYSSRFFIIMHEVGHYYHASEEACDRFAARAMRSLGFNPSQISAATRHALSHHSAKRHKVNDAFARRLDKQRNR